MASLSSLRADQWVMLGVVGIGLYAVLRMSRATKAGQRPPTPEELPNIPILNLPPLPGTPTVPAGTTEVTAPSLAGLRPNDWFGGRIETIAPSGVPLLTQSNGAVISSPADLAILLGKYGFGGSAVRPDSPEAIGQPLGVTVFDASNAKGHVPEYALSNAGQGTRWFYGRWLGGRGQAERPPWMVLLWRARPPS